MARVMAVRLHFGQEPKCTDFKYVAMFVTLSLDTKHRSETKQPFNYRRNMPITHTAIDDIRIKPNSIWEHTCQGRHPLTCATFILLWPYRKAACVFQRKCQHEKPQEHIPLHSHLYVRRSLDAHACAAA